MMATVNSGLPVSFSVVSGNAYVSGGNYIQFLGVGNITVQASQAGNANYNAATPVQHTFCVRVDTIYPAIQGAATACLNTYTYRAQKIPGANYIWSLDGGGTLVSSNDTAFVTWTSSGTHVLSVKANTHM